MERKSKSITSTHEILKRVSKKKGSPDHGPAAAVEATFDWVIDIAEVLRKEGANGNDVEFDLGKSWTIYKVPRNMKEVYREAYIPRLISIGPYHHGRSDLQLMEAHKMRYLLLALGYNAGSKEGLGGRDTLVRRRLEEISSAVRELEDKTRGCYADDVEFGSDEFVKMMVVDGCFVIQLLRFYGKFDHDEYVDDPIFAARWMLRTLQRDLLMLENQLPFFVLEKLFELTSTGPQLSLVDLVLAFFDPLLPREGEVPKPNPKEQHRHMLDVFRLTFLMPLKERTCEKSSWTDLKSPNNTPLVRERQLIHCVSELQDSGIKLQKRGRYDLLEIEFEHNTLEIPPLNIDDNTVPLFLNFIAYEQCDEVAKPYLTNYFMFFDSLISSKDDIEILHRHGIVDHVMGNHQDAARLINRLCREIVYDLDQCYLSRQMKEINAFCDKYYSHQWRLWWRNLIDQYFSSPWSFISLVAAVFLLLLQVGQTLYTIYPYYVPPK